MAIKQPLWLEQLEYSATEMRSLIAGAFPLPGCMEDGDLKVSQHGAGAMIVDVAAGSAVVAGTAEAEQGSYYFSSDAVVNVDIDPAPGAGQSRYDLIVTVIEDDDADSGGNNQGVITVVKGTAAATGSQVVPGAPDSSLQLARVLVGPSVTEILTANITDYRTFAHDKDTKIGEIKILTGTALPGAGWEWGDGSAVSRTGPYAAAFAAMGTAWGNGDGSTTFDKPSLRNFFLVGAGGTYALAASGGEATHTLTEAEMPPHSHGGATGGQSADHAHPESPLAASTASSVGLVASETNQAALSDSENTGGSLGDHTHSISADGGGDAHNNLPPYKGVNIAVCMR